MPDPLTRSRAAPMDTARAGLAGAATALAVLAPAGQANFTTGKCQGSNITGRGASFANAAHAGWKTSSRTTTAPTWARSRPSPTTRRAAAPAGASWASAPAPNADGSQSRNQVPRFGMTDEPPTPTAVSQMNQGTDAAGDEGTIHVIPGAVGSVVAGRQLPGQLRPLAAAGLGRDQPGGGQRGAVQRPRALHAHAGRGDLERGLGPRPVDRDLPDARRRRGLQRVHHPRRAVRRLGHDVRVQGLPRHGQPGSRLGPRASRPARHAQLAERGARAARRLRRHSDRARRART